MTLRVSAISKPEGMLEMPVMKASHILVLIFLPNTKPGSHIGFGLGV